MAKSRWPIHSWRSSHRHSGRDGERVVTIDGQPERNLTEDLRPFWIAVFAFAAALIVSHLALRRPRLQSLQPAVELIGTMRELEREGRLEVTEAKDGTISIGVAVDR